MSMLKSTILRGANIGLSILVFLAVLVLIALIAHSHPWRLDLTKSGRHTLSEQTRKIVSGLQKPIEIKAFYQEAQEGKKQTQYLLESYKYVSSMIGYKFIDPDRQPAQARKYDVKSYSTLVLEGYGRTQTITSPDEQRITNAILKLTSDKEKVIYFLTGHGERDIEDHDQKGFFSLKEAVEKENYTVKNLNLMREKIPADCTVLVVADPGKPLFKEEIEVIKTYLQQGGQVLVMLAPYRDGGLKDFLHSYGFELKDDLVVDRMSRLFGGDSLIPIINSYGRHEITEKFTLASFFPLTRTIGETDESPEGVFIADLAATSAESWSETDREALNKGEAEYDEDKDTMGPLTVAAIASIHPPKAEKASSHPNGEEGRRADAQKSAAKQADAPAQPGQLAVFGNTDFAANSYLEMAGNRDFILNTISFLARDKNQIAIRSKAADIDSIMLSRRQGTLLFWISLVVMPCLVLACGLAAYRIRRRSK